jgi:hypothetical protein
MTVVSFGSGVIAPRRCRYSNPITIANKSIHPKVAIR